MKFIPLITLFISLNLWANEIIVPLGQSRFLPLSSKRIWIQDRQVIAAEPVGTRLRLKAIREGSTILQINDKIFRVQVLHPFSIDLYHQFHKITQKIPGLQIKMRKGDVLVTGNVYRWKDWKKLADSVDEDGLTYRMQAKISPIVQRRAEFEIQKLLEINGLRSQKIVFADHIELRIPANHPDSLQLKKLLGPLGISIVFDKTQLQSEPTIKVQITVAEVQKDLMRSWGVEWPSSFAAQATPHFQLLGDPVALELNALESHGQGRVLASPNLICQSGQEAEFTAGGEFPVKFVNNRVREVLWKRYGIFLKVKPRADSSGRMNLKIESEVSSLSQIIDGIPSLITHKVSSTFDLNESRTIVLSGLLKEQTNRSSSGLAFLTQIPILGRLFSSEDFLEKRTELLVFVKPEILTESKYLKPDTRLGHLSDTSEKQNK